MKSKPISQAEALEILSKKKVRTSFEENELLFLERFKKIDKKSLEKIKKNLSQIKKLNEESIAKLIDTRPTSVEEITPILNSFGILLDEKDLNIVINSFSDL
ncbi:MAG: Rpb4 family DNA-directed RNA polymerase subunit [Thermoplasmataceae archaeon]